jgi:heme/copper-type cytochrome/quinol oxidase subunit 2
MGTRRKLSILLLVVLTIVAAFDYSSTRSLGSWLVSNLFGGHGSTSPPSPPGPTHSNNSTVVMFKHFRLTISYITYSGGNATLVNSTFLPDQINVNTGDNLMINLTNTDSITHGFTIEGLSSPETVDPGQTISVILSNIKLGTYAFYCQLHNNHSRGIIYVS